MSKLITLTEAKDYISVGAGVTSYDDRLNTLIDTATKQIEQFTRREFVKGAKTEYFATEKTGTLTLDLFGASDTGFVTEAQPQRIQLKAVPVDSGEDFNVYYDTARVWASTSLVLDADYFVDYETSVITLMFATVKSPRSIKVTYTGGWAESGGTMSDAAPDDLKLACLNQVIYLFDKLQTRSVGLATQSEDDGRDYRADSGILCGEAMKLAAPYKIFRFS